MNNLVHITYHEDSVTVGHWCDTCLLPSVMRIPLVAITMDGVGECGTMLMCMNCMDDFEGGVE